jgi:hypothetical protein
VGENGRSLGVVFVAAGLMLGSAIAVTRPGLRDPDSTLYAAMSSQLTAQPLAAWMTPEWPANRMKTGRFVEHTAVSLWPGAVLERVGLSTGALVANVLCAVVLLWLVGRLASVLAPGSEPLAWAAWGLSIIGVQYWLRANHEIWWATASLAALLGVASRWPRWTVVALTVAGCSIKGPLGLDTVLLVAPLAWVVHGRRWLVLYGVFSGLAVLAFVALYDLAFQRVTGTSFVSAYFSTQVGYVLDSETSVWLTKPRNLVVYLGKLIWFSLPGALLLAWAKWKKKRISRETIALLIGLLLVVVATSFMSRQAGRYIFPCYTVLAVIGSAAAVSSKLSGLLQRRASVVLAVVLLVALGRVLFASAVYREVNLLPGTRVTVQPAQTR